MQGAALMAISEDSGHSLVFAVSCSQSPDCSSAASSFGIPLPIILFIFFRSEGFSLF
jgi:hypothetical protein